MKLLNRRYFPLAVYIGYVGFVFLALYFGPLQYRNIDLVLVTSYVCLATLLFTIGYIFGARGEIKRPDYVIDRYFSLTRRAWVVFFINVLLVLGVFVAVLDWVELFSHGVGFSFTKLGESYVSAYEGYERGQAKVDFMYVLNIFRHALMAVCLMFSTYYFQGYKPYQKKIFLLVTISYLVIQVLGSGKQKYLGDCVIALGIYLLFLRARFDSKISAKGVLLGGTGVIIIFYLFIEILKQRYTAVDIGIHNIDAKAHSLIYWDHDSFVFDLIGDEYGFALGIFLGYFTNGLYGLSLCLQLPFEWTYFAGNSYSITRIVEIILGDDGAIQKLSYPVRAGVEFGWDATKWHSLYAWLASDFTFIGTLLIAILFGYFYGKLWIWSVNCRYFSSGPLFALLSLGLVFSLANNQLVHSLSGIVSLLIILLFLLIERICVHKVRSELIVANVK